MKGRRGWTLRHVGTKAATSQSWWYATCDGCGAQNRSSLPVIGRLWTRSDVDGLVRLLHTIDGQLGLAAYRGEGATEQWIREARDLISRIRKTVADLENGASDG